MLDIALLGTGGTMPLPNRFLTSMLAAYKGKMLLIDCGEGNQVSLKMLKWGFKAIGVICFTHFHADHIAGLPGFLLTMGNSGRTEPVLMIGPEGLEDILRGILMIARELPFEIRMVELKERTAEINQDSFTIRALAVDHTLPCYAYQICIDRMPEFDKEKAVKSQVPVRLWNTLQKGNKVTENGIAYTPDMVLGRWRKGLKVCYQTDSRPVPAITSFISDADLFICEGMYGDDDYLRKAEENKHMLFSEAAVLAQEGNVKELWLTHFSPALNQPELYLVNSKRLFENTIIGTDRMTKTLHFET